MIQRGELGFLPGVGETEAAADLAITGSKRRIRANPQLRIKFKPRRIQHVQQFHVPFAEGDFQAFTLGIKLFQRFLTKARDDFRRRLITREQSATDLDGETGQSLSNLGVQIWLQLGQFFKHAVAELLHVMPELDHLLVGCSPRGIDATTIGRLGELGQLHVVVIAAASAWQRSATEWTVEGDEFGVGHGKNDQATTAWDSESREMRPSSSSLRTAWMIVS